MEYCAVQAPLGDSPGRTEVYNVERFGNVVLAVLCTGYKFPDSAFKQLLDFWSKNLLQCIAQSKDFPLHMESALASGFERMDPDERVHEKFGLTNSRLTCLVAVVDLHKRVVHTAGWAEARVSILAEKSSRTLFRRFCFPHPLKQWKSFHFHQEPLKADDKHLVIASEEVYDSLLTPLRPILETRIRQVGLVEACKAIVGRFEVDCKTLIVLTLKEGVHRPYPDSPPLPVRCWQQLLKDLQQMDHQIQKDECRRYCEYDYDEEEEEEEHEDYNYDYDYSYEEEEEQKEKGEEEKEQKEKEKEEEEEEEEEDHLEDLKELEHVFPGNTLDERTYLRPLWKGETKQDPEPIATNVYSMKGTFSAGTIKDPLVSQGLRAETENGAKFGDGSFLQGKKGLNPFAKEFVPRFFVERSRVQERLSEGFTF